MSIGRTSICVVLALVVSSVGAVTINVPADQPTIQAGIDFAADGDTVLVAPGMYLENINLNGKSIELGSWFLTTADTNYISQTVIDGHSLGTVITVNNGEDSTTIITGITVQNGYAENGGGIRCENTNPWFVNVIIVDNYAANGGGGMDNFGGSPKLINCFFLSNAAGNYGGGISNDLSSPTISNCVFSGNTAVYSGGAISNYTFSEPVFTNCVIANNSAVYGAGIWNGGATPTLVNCIVWGNTPDEFYGSESVVTYSDIQGGWTGEGNIDTNPLFRDAAQGDYHLSSVSCGDTVNSPCMDAGDPNTLDGLLDCLWGLGAARSDMGAYGGNTTCCVQRGDVNHVPPIDISDLTYLVAFLFGGGSPPVCAAEGDIDGSGSIDIADLTYLVAFLFGGGPAPPECLNSDGRSKSPQGFQQ